MGTGLGWGLLHAFNLDHLAAVSAFINRDPSPKRAVYTSLIWGLGHGATILILGVGGAVLGLTLPPTLNRYAELLVGATLVGLGLWLLRDLIKGRGYRDLHRPDNFRQAHLHSQNHRHAAGLVGMAHGLAGTAPLILLMPISMHLSPLLVSGYLLAFGVGAVLAMSGYALVASLVYGRIPARLARLFTGLFSLALGLIWLWSS